MPIISAASYNMSLVADLNLIMNSEKHRCTANTTIDDTKSIKAGWLNSLEKVKAFVIDHKHGDFVIGMQEMNNYYKLTSLSLRDNFYLEDPIKQMNRYNANRPESTDRYARTGVQYIVSELQKLSKSKDEIKYHFGGVNGSFDTFPSLLTVWNARLGDAKYTETVDLCVEHNKFIEENDKDSIYNDKANQEQSGRLSTIILTTMGYTFINLHGINKYGHSAHYTNWLKDFIVKKISETKNIDANKLIIMGDFNDPHNYIKKLTLLDTSFSYGSSVIKSCCYNYTSSCSYKLAQLGLKICQAQEPAVVDNGVPRRIKPFTRNELENELWNVYLQNYDTLAEYIKYFEIHIYYNQCPILVFNEQLYKCLHNDIIEPNVKKIVQLLDETVPYSSARIMGDRGDVKNYKFTGDYVFMSNILRNNRKLDIFNGPTDTIGKASDHEMVYIGTPLHQVINRNRRSKNQHTRTQRNRRNNTKPIYT